MGILDKIGISGVKRKAIHVVRVACNQCDQIFDDKWYEDEYSDKTAGRKCSTGMHMIQCPYCGHINHKDYSHVNDVISQGRFRDFAEDQFYGTRYGPLPADPRFNKIDKDPKKMTVRDLNDIPFTPRKVA